MAKKKKGGKKKDDGGGPAAPTSSFQPLVLVPIVEEWVTLDLKLLNWNYMNFHHRCKTSDTRLFQIKKLLTEKHGRIKDLKVCKEQFAERNEMTDDMMTLKAYGIKGAAQDAAHVVYTLHYDFTPMDADDPLLLFTAGPDAAGQVAARDPLLDA